VTGQFEGYLQEAGVAPASIVPTYAALRMQIDSWRWDGVPIFVRAGKSLAMTATEVVVEFHPPPRVVFHEGMPPVGNSVRFRLGPNVAIGIGASAKRPGEAMVGEPTELTVMRSKSADEMDAYERLIGEAMQGDPTLFARQDAVEAAWALVDPLLDIRQTPARYEPGTWGPSAADQLTADSGGWRTPA
jgi:glucose-6-phosphate 1-dehydrogenase